ncbi:trimethylguanosine synthase, putative [Plasmodium berghei]|uniref:Trimethylguanosine synthase n=2 Tax=Plasmodium berghei TaxID=5821 RepID=A0A509AIU1_PLABA|nr:trimethylguanosine synthase, putative [Plasmodium berghei ANKA]CXI15094.1 trimethylguanosine synthase, putative [Plasmodium berghei]SCM19542.1 trimethylguanosine synthase, putative [Plasmodium berghei]SCN23288.1 trimethylguanosine synthase, putative [Plasmodium berghei]SCO59004.1 trimethylguanosine synthase, putative [Plasmodium berghei]SCO59517.1 trimethylguanosine synthase, putative [Plasmodium berghei]|eukprot:XP_034420515.1 trimethylguanosine synthase, putative [Plasmodium berghei ANKA]
MMKIKYKNFNGINKDKKKGKEEMDWLNFLVHPCYYTIFDLEKDDLLNEDIRLNFLYYAENLNIYDKEEILGLYKKNDNIARELSFTKSCELIKKSYKLKIPIIFQNLKNFDLHKNDIIDYLSVNYKLGHNCIVRKEMKKVEKKKCFIIDSEMIYSMTPEYISNKIANNILMSNKINCWKMKENLLNEKENTKYTESMVAKKRVNKLYKCNKNMITIHLDPFSGAGGNCNAMKNVFTIASDINLNRLKQCQHNCKFYNNNIDYILCDFFNIVNHFRENVIDVVFLSIPWGGPSYKKKKKFDLKNKEKNLCVYTCLKESIKLTKNIIIYLPRNVCINDLYFLFKTYKKLCTLKNKDTKINCIENKKMERKNYNFSKKCDMLIELYVNRNRCTYKDICESNLMNYYYYYFNKKKYIYNNKIKYDKVKNLFKINIDQCNNYLKETSEIKNKCISNKKCQNDDICFQINEQIANSNVCNTFRRKNNTLWKWHNTCMVIYFGDISKKLKNKKAINYDYVYYIHNKLGKSITKFINYKLHQDNCMVNEYKYSNRNMSIYRLLYNEKIQNVFDIVKNLEKKLFNSFKRQKKNKNEELKEENNENLKKMKLQAFNITRKNIVILKDRVNKLLYKVISYILQMFYNNVKNLIGFDNFSFFNKIYINLENIQHKFLTRKIYRNTNIKKYVTYIYSHYIDNNSGLNIMINHFNVIIMKIKKELILLFGIYLYDINFLKYYFKYHKINISINNVCKKNMGNIHYIIVRFLFNFLMYICIFLNILNNNIRLQEFINKNIINNGSDSFSNLLKIPIKDFDNIFDINKNNFLFSFQKFLKRIILLSIKIEVLGKSLSMDKTINIFFNFIFKKYDIDYLLNYIRHNNEEGNTNEKWYQLCLFLITINFFTKQFFYNINVTSYLDYFNSLNYFYFNRMRILSRHCKSYSNLFIFNFSSFMEKHFCVQIL